MLTSLFSLFYITGEFHRLLNRGRARISTYHFYMRHIHAAINFLDLALELGRQSTHSSPESLFGKSFQKTDPGPWTLMMISRHCQRHCLI